MANVRKAGDRIKDNPEVLDAMEDPGPAANGGIGSTSDLSAKDEGFRNSLERRLGTDEYDRIGASGHQDPTDAGQYSAAEVIAEFRNAKKNGYSGVDEGDNSVLDYFKQLKEDGATFNNKAQEYLGKYGMDFTKSKPDTPAVEEDPISTIPTTPDDKPEIEVGISEPVTSITAPDEDTAMPMPTMPAPSYSPGVGNNGSFNVGGDLTQNVGKTGDMTTTIGDGNTIGAGVQIGNDFSTTIGGNHAGNTNYFGTALNEEKQRRASQGAFAPGVGSGLNFS